ncbi:MliC family protein [Psychrobacter sp. HII-4]|uniref:MliC family protein n=1 Tax=Psychrobacter sp. HII-4 TaxID=1569264 RepID=UPI001917E6BF|nr:MliC family protein [Psychrobacter sp. HII-4]
MTNPNATVYNCENDGQISTAYANNGGAVDLNITLPEIGLSNQKMILTQAVSGSGARYVNNDNSNYNYEWQSKADYGVMSIQSVDGREYSVNCQA